MPAIPNTLGECPNAIEVDRVSKAYRIWQSPAGRLTAPLVDGIGRHIFRGTSAGRALQRRAAAGYRDFWALKDISFDVRRGEAIGIIGRNGSGKSTLLQIIAGTLQSTNGSVSVCGRVAALLELGSGFNPEFSGRENVFLNGAVLGLSKLEIEERFDAIAAFADIGEFIDHPVKTYSSGMQMRLAFAVAAHVDPQVLIVDEALAVGDARFQLKCAATIDRFLEEGVTLLFVSHDLNMVKRLCSRAVLLEGGRVVHAGNPNDVANLYSKLIADGGSVEALAEDIRALGDKGAATIDAAEKQPAEPAPAPIPAAPGRNAVLFDENAKLRARLEAMTAIIEEARGGVPGLDRVAKMLREERAGRQVSSTEFSYGGELGRIHEVEILDKAGAQRAWFTTGEPIEVRLRIEAFSDMQEPIFALTIKDKKGQDIYGTNTLFSRQSSAPLAHGDKRTVRFLFPCNLMPEEYFLSIGFTQYVGDELVVIHRRYDVIKFSVHGTDRCFGIANCFARITVEPV